MLTRNKGIGAQANHHADMARTDKPIQAQPGRVQNRFNRGNDGDMIAENGKIFAPLCLRTQQGNSRRGGSGFKTNREKDDLAIRVPVGKFKRIEWGVDKTHIGSIGLCIEQTTL